jgi:hypothetical protein
VRDQVHDGAKMGGYSYRLPAYPVAPGTEVPEEDMVIMTTMPVKSLITNPPTGSQVDRVFSVRGHAWADGAVESVETSIDFGQTWQPASPGGAAQPLCLAAFHRLHHGTAGRLL